VACAGPRGFGLRAADLRRAGSRARQRDCASRPQTGQHQNDAGRQDQGPGLRSGVALRGGAPWRYGGQGGIFIFLNELRAARPSDGALNSLGAGL
jgi:hypothetical protein